MKLSTARRRINKTLDELTRSVIDDWHANFKNGYIKGYADARQGISPMYAEAYATADTPQTESWYKFSSDCDLWQKDSTCIGCYRYDICKQASADTLQTERSE